MKISIKEIPLFQGLTSEQLSAVQQCLHEKSFGKGETLFLEGHLCDRIFFVREGRVKVYRLGSTGREQVLETLEPGGTCACNPGTTDWHCSSSAEAMTACTVWFLSTERYAQLLKKNIELAHSLNKVLSGRLQCFGTMIEDMSLKDSRKRSAKLLLELPMGLTHEELAKRIGVVRETFERQLHYFKSLGLIEVEDHKIRVLDKAGLEKHL